MQLSFVGTLVLCWTNYNLTIYFRMKYKEGSTFGLYTNQKKSKQDIGFDLL